MRQLAALLLVALLAVVAPAPTAAQATVRVFVDGAPVSFDQPPIVVGSRVLVPLRGVFERMGATVSWEASTRTVIAIRTGTVVELAIGRPSALVNDRLVALDVPPMIVAGRTLVPLRFISEALGAAVQYQEATRTVLIFSPGAQPLPPAPLPPAPPPVFAPTPAPPAVHLITGTLLQVRPGGATPAILVDQDGGPVLIVITPATVITRVNLSTNVGRTVSLNALRVGDEVEARVGADARAAQIRATFRTVLGQLSAVTAGGRTLVLTNGQAYRVADSGVVVTIDGAASSVGALRSGMIVTLRLNPRTSLVYGIAAETLVGQNPTVRPAPPIITAPDAGQAIASPVRVQGAAPGAANVVITIDAMLGVRVASATVAVAANGRFSAVLTYQPLFTGWPYVITVIALNEAGVESDPATVTVRQL